MMKAKQRWHGEGDGVPHNVSRVRRQIDTKRKTPARHEAGVTICMHGGGYSIPGTYAEHDI